MCTRAGKTSSCSLKVSEKFQRMHLISLFGLVLCRFLTWHTTKSKIEKKVHSVIDNFAEHGLRSLGVARQVTDKDLIDNSLSTFDANVYVSVLNFFFGFFLQEVPERNKDSSGGPWEFIALLPLFDPPRHDSAETIRRALELGVSDILH